jgi:hypothetical protein
MSEETSFILIAAGIYTFYFFWIYDKTGPYTSTLFAFCVAVLLIIIFVI